MIHKTYKIIITQYKYILESIKGISTLQTLYLPNNRQIPKVVEYLTEYLKENNTSIELVMKESNIYPKH